MANVIINIGWYERVSSETTPVAPPVNTITATLDDGTDPITTAITASGNWYGTFENVEDGTYTLSVETIEYFDTPATQEVIVSSSDEAVTMDYVRSAAMPYDDNIYCEFDSTAAAVTAGKNILFCLFDTTGTNLLALAGQQSFDLSIESDSQDASTKDTAGGWGAEIAGTKTWTVSVEGLTAKGDESQKQLLQALVNSRLLCMKVVEEITDEEGTVTYAPLYGGLVNATSYSDSAPFDDMRSYTAEFAGVGKLWIAAIAPADEITGASAVPSNR